MQPRSMVRRRSKILDFGHSLERWISMLFAPSVLVLPWVLVIPWHLRSWLHLESWSRLGPWWTPWTVWSNLESWLHLGSWSHQGSWSYLSPGHAMDLGHILSLGCTFSLGHTLDFVWQVWPPCPVQPVQLLKPSLSNLYIAITCTEYSSPCEPITNHQVMPPMWVELLM